MTAAVKPEPSPCRCGCDGTSRGLFVPGHDARYKGALARRLYEAQTADPVDVFDGPGEAARIRAECDAIDVAYGRPPGKWRGLVEKQAENLRLSATKDAQRAARGTPVRRVARQLAAIARNDDPDARFSTHEYIDDLMERLRHRRAAGMVGWAPIGGERVAVRIWATGHDQGVSTIKVRALASGEFHDIAADLFHRDIDLEHAN